MEFKQRILIGFGRCFFVCNLATRFPFSSAMRDEQPDGRSNVHETHSNQIEHRERFCEPNLCIFVLKKFKLRFNLNSVWFYRISEKKNSLHNNVCALTWTGRTISARCAALRTALRFTRKVYLWGSRGSPSSYAVPVCSGYCWWRWSFIGIHCQRSPVASTASSSTRRLVTLRETWNDSSWALRDEAKKMFEMFAKSSLTFSKRL